MTPVATMHVYSVHGVGVARALTRMALDRPLLRRTPGLRFAKLLGTGDGQTFAARDADVHRWAMFSVWSAIEYADRFENRSAWGFADETWRIDLEPQRWHGSWGGRDPFEGCSPVMAGAGRVAVVTRARVRARQWRAFTRAIAPVASSALTAPGRLFAIGIGEAPIGFQATFSLWADTPSLESFAYRGDAHRNVVARTRSEHWYAEELFARFKVCGSHGTIDGQPL